MLKPSFLNLEGKNHNNFTSTAGSNLLGRSPTDCKSVTLTTWTYGQITTIPRFSIYKTILQPYPDSEFEIGFIPIIDYWFTCFINFRIQKLKQGFILIIAFPVLAISDEGVLPIV